MAGSPLPTIPQVIVNSNQIVRLLKRKSLGKLIDATLEYVSNLPINESKQFKKSTKNTDELKIVDVSLLTCGKSSNYGNSSVAKKCSEHGKCDHFSGKCVCDKFWMSNLYLYYLRNDLDLTSGNNCGKTIFTLTFIIKLKDKNKFYLLNRMECSARHVFFYFYLCSYADSFKYIHQIRPVLFTVLFFVLWKKNEEKTKAKTRHELQERKIFGIWKKEIDKLKQ